MGASEVKVLRSYKKFAMSLKMHLGFSWSLGHYEFHSNLFTCEVDSCNSSFTEEEVKWFTDLLKDQEAVKQNLSLSTLNLVLSLYFSVRNHTLKCPSYHYPGASSLRP